MSKNVDKVICSCLSCCNILRNAISASRENFVILLCDQKKNELKVKKMQKKAHYVTEQLA